MTEPHHEPSYYEIALTNRQVVVAFLALLIVLLAVFFSGVWIGRGGIEPRRDQLAQASPSPTPPPEGRSVEELKFFSDKEPKKAPQAKATPPPPAAKPAPPATPELTVTPAAVPATPAPRPEPKPADPPADREKKAKPGAESGGAIVIQVFASADPAEAKRVRERLVKGGQAAAVSPLTTDGRTMYRVRIGPFTSRPKAQKVAESVRKKFKLDTWLTE